MQKTIITTLIFLFFTIFLYPQEAPIVLSKTNEQIPDSLYTAFYPDTLFSSSPIIQINNQYTGSLISENGLVLTTLKALTDKYPEISLSNQKETPLRNWYARRQLYSKDVTDIIFEGIDSTFSSVRKNLAVGRNIRKLINETPKQENEQLKVEEAYNGQRYFLYAWENFTDLRLVKADSSNGQLLLRLYRRDQPYPSSNFLTKADSLPSEGSWTAVLGYPKRTVNNLLPLQKILFFNDLLPSQISRRQLMLEAWEKQRNLSPDLTRQLDRLKKEQTTWEELAYQSLTLYVPARLQQQHNRILGTAKANHPYRQSLVEQQKLLKEYHVVEEAALIFEEVLNKNLQLFRLFRQIQQIRDGYSRSEAEKQERLATTLGDFYETFDRELEVYLLENAVILYFEKMPVRFISPEAGQKYAESKKEPEEMARIAFSSSLFFKPKLLQAKLEQGPDAFMAMTERDYLFSLWQLIKEGYDFLKKEEIRPINQALQEIQNHYLDLLRKKDKLIPEAKGHLRISLGQLLASQGVMDHHLAKGMEGAPVINKNGKMVGIFTEGEPAWLDLGEWLYERGMFEWEYKKIKE